MSYITGAYLVRKAGFALLRIKYKVVGILTRAVLGLVWIISYLS